MWKCPKCKRIFQKTDQMHSCKSYPIELHFKNKEKAKEIYDELLSTVKSKVGKLSEISLPCCIHWYGTYEFLALLAKSDKLEVRFALDREIKNKRIYVSVRLSSSSFKNCLYLNDINDIDDELLDWIRESYNMKDKKTK